jgi:hypothetical protein
MGVGLAAVGAGAVLILTSRSAQPAEARDAPAARLLPAVGPEGGGIQIVGAF